MQSNETTCITKRDPQGKYLAHRHQIQARHNTHTPIANTNDPSAGSPTETLLRLLLPLSDKVYYNSYAKIKILRITTIQIIHRITQSVGATGGVYKGQGRNQPKLMTLAY